MKSNLRTSILLLFIIFSSGMQTNNAFAQTFRTFNKPVVFDELRKKLSVEYLKERHGIIQDSATIVPRMIVLHWTAIPTLEQSFDVMNPALLPGARSGIAGASSLKCGGTVSSGSRWSHFQTIT